MSKFIKAKLINNKFECKICGIFENKDSFNNNIVIDTGCMKSHISADLIYIFLSDEERLKEKEKWMKCRKTYIGIGVESQNKNIDTSINVSNPRVMVQQQIYGIEINGVKLGNRYMSVSYDTSMVALLGMDFLKDWDIHIGTTLTGETIFLACPKDQLNDAYFRELNRLFGIGTSIITAEAYND